MSEYIGIAFIVLAVAALCMAEGYSSSKCVEAGGTWRGTACSGHCEKVRP